MPLLFAYGINRFSHDVAHLMNETVLKAHKTQEEFSVTSSGLEA